VHAGVPSEGQPAGSANLGFDPPPRVQKLVAHLKQFMDEHIYPSEHILEAHAADPKTKWTIHPRMEELKVQCQYMCLTGTFAWMLEFLAIFTTWAMSFKHESFIHKR